MPSRALVHQWVAVICLIACSALTHAADQTPAEVVKAAPRGSLKNPYDPTMQDKVDRGHELFQSYSCGGCHGATGGGGMCPPLTGDAWYFGIDDDALFRLVTLGTQGMQAAGYQHLGASGTPMPPMGGVIKTDDDLWEIVTWIRSVYQGDPKNKFW